MIQFCIFDTEQWETRTNQSITSQPSISNRINLDLLTSHPVINEAKDSESKDCSITLLA